MAISYNTSIVRNGLVLHLDAANVKSYPGSGTSWNDMSGNRNTGTLISSPTYNYNNGGYFTMTGTEYVDCGNPSSVNVTGDFSLEIWFTASALVANYQNLISKGDYLGSYRLARAGSSSKLEYAINLGTGGDGVVGSTVINLNTWYCATMVYTLSSPSIRGYINGNLDGSVSGGTAINSSSYNLFIGQNSQDQTRFWRGNISSVRIYNISLSAAEIQQNFNALRGRYGI